MNNMRMTLTSLLLITVAHVAQAATSPAEFDKALLPYLQTHCVRCRNAEKQEGEFRIDKLSKNDGTENNPQWLEVMERINSGEMPPKTEAKRPTADKPVKHRILFTEYGKGPNRFVELDADAKVLQP